MDVERRVDHSGLVEGVSYILRRLRVMMKELCPERASSIEQDLLCGSLIEQDGLSERISESGFNVSSSTWRLAQPNEIRVVVRCVRRDQHPIELYGQLLVEYDTTNDPH